MKLNTKILFLTLLIFPFLSCNKPNDESSVDPKQEVKENPQEGDFKTALQEISRVLDKAILDGDHETLLKYYTDDITVMPIFEPVVRGKDALRKAYKKDKKAGVKYHAFNARHEKMWACGNDVFEYGKFGLAVSSKETEHPYAYHGSYFAIWEKQTDGSYLMKYVITNLDHKPY